jgi:transmembrane protein
MTHRGAARSGSVHHVRRNRGFFEEDPMTRPIALLLDSPLFSLAARVLLTFMFWSSGLAKLLDFPATLGEMSHFGLSPAAPIAVAVIIVLLGGSALIIAGRHAWLGAGALGIFTLLTIPIAHAFWTMSGQEAFIEKLWVTEHLSVVGALMAVAVLCHDRRAIAPDLPPERLGGTA